MRQVLLGALFGFFAALLAVSSFGNGSRPAAPVEASPVLPPEARSPLGAPTPVRAPLPMRTLRNLPIKVPYISPDAGR